MSTAVVCAGGAGVAAAVAMVDALALRARRPRGRPASVPRGRPASVLAAALTHLGRRAGLRAHGADLDDLLAAAGAPLGLSAADVAALKGGAALAGAAVALLFAGALPGRLGLLAFVVVPLAGFLGPDALLARRARRRGEAMAREVADVLDLLRVAVEAGLPTGRALGEVGRRRGGPLAAELRRASTELSLGVPRPEALRRLAARCPVPEVGALVAAVTRSDRHGAPLAPSLAALATEARAEQARRVHDGAARAAPKIQLVVALVLVPAVMLLVAAALIQALVPS